MGHHRLNLAFHFSSESAKASHFAKLDANAGTVRGVRLKTTNNSKEELDLCEHIRASSGDNYSLALSNKYDLKN